MGLLDAVLPDSRRWGRVGDYFEVTRKPRRLRVADYEAVPFVPMEAIPQGGHYEPRYDQKPGTEITSGTYFERGDLLIAKITPSFENGKQAWAEGLPASFGYATTEVIPLRPSAPGNDRRLLFFYLLHPEIRSYVSERMEGSTGRQRVPEQVLLDLPYPELPPEDQQAIADTLERITQQIELEDRSARTTQELKHAAMRELFTRGLRGEPQKETEIGLVPESWGIRTVAESVHPFRFDRSKQVPKSAYQKVGRWPVIDQGQEDVAGYTNDSEKVIAPNQPIIIFGDHTRIFKFVDFPFVLGADGTKPLLARDEFIPKFLFYVLSALEIPARGYNRHFTVLSEMHVPHPALDEQREIVTILDAIDRKIELHRKKRAVLEELFKALLHKLMTGEIRVAELDLSAIENDRESASYAAETAMMHPSFAPGSKPSPSHPGSAEPRGFSLPE
jgi:type I restriction enzyme S subunit